jgi:hypothetical protein
VLSNLAIAIASRVFGPLILTPTLVTMNTVWFAAAARRRWLAPTIAISLGFLIAPPAPRGRRVDRGDPPGSTAASCT